MNPYTKDKNRIAHYDILRGIAISLMLMANSAAYVYTATPPLFMRLAGSFAAPCFMMLVGMMLALTKKPKPIRGLYIIAVGALVDVGIWHIMPFVTFDVLYTIGAAIAITAYPARLFSIKSLWILGVLFFLIGQVLQWVFDYHHEILEIALPPVNPLPTITVILFQVFRQLFIDGWFPLFPWLGFVWLGVALQRGLQLQSENEGYSDNWLNMLFSFLSLAASSAYWMQSFVAPEPRMGYTELFYPPDIGFCFTYTSAFCVILFFFQLIVRSQFISFISLPLQWLGHCSLWIYILHLILIQYILSQYFQTAELAKFLFVVLISWIFLVMIARFLLSPAFKVIYKSNPN